MLGGVREVETTALEALTLLDSKPYFFLFSDIDTREPSVLLSVLKFYRYNRLSCYFYNTNSGYHVMSPCLLTFRKWCFLTERLRNLIPNYRFDALRVTRRLDMNVINYAYFNHKKFKESRTLHNYMQNRFKILDEVIPTKPRDSELSFIKYHQLTFH